jgi:hypothetical protein
MPFSITCSYGLIHNSTELYSNRFSRDGSICGLFLTHNLSLTSTVCVEIVVVSSDCSFCVHRRSSSHSCKSHQFFGAFAKFRKTIISFILSACPYLRPSAWSNSAPSGSVLMKFDMSIFRKYFEKIQVSLKSDKSNGYFT